MRKRPYKLVGRGLGVFAPESSLKASKSLLGKLKREASDRRKGRGEAAGDARAKPR